MDPEELKATARLLNEAIKSRNLALIENHPGYLRSRQILPQLLAAFPDLSGTVEQQTVEGEWVTTRVTMRGTHRGDFLGVAPTGKAIELMNISLDQVVDGKVVEHFGVTDWLGALVAFGIVSLPDIPASAATNA